jgi:hypothetical protein
MLDLNDDIEVYGITKLQWLELKDECPYLWMTPKPIEKSSDQMGEPTTIILAIGGGIAALIVLLPWLVKKSYKFELNGFKSEEKPNGVRKVSIDNLVIKDSGPPGPKTIEQLRQIPGFSPEWIDSLRDD